MKLEIKVYKDSRELPDTSKWLNERQIIPNKDDVVTLQGKDADIVGIDRIDTRCQMNVKRRHFPHAHCDVAIVLEFDF